MIRILLSRIRILIILGFIGFNFSLCQGVIIDFKTLQVDFKNITDATTKTTWSDMTRFTVTREGLGWSGDSVSSHHGWIQTNPMALGFMWRTPTGVKVHSIVALHPADTTGSNGQKMISANSALFARYSPDKKHWSTWQSISSIESTGSSDKTILLKHYTSLVQIPKKEHEDYGNLLSKYSELDVPWKSNEEDAVKWILKDDPEFFSKHLPFIGYIQFLYDGDFYANQRVQTLTVNIYYWMGGLHAIPKDETLYKDIMSIPWRFDASSDNSK